MVQLHEEPMADAITKLFDTTLEQLIAVRDEHYSAAIKELDDESDALAREYAQLEKDIKAIEECSAFKGAANSASGG